jgi:hypothetical protein
LDATPSEPRSSCYFDTIRACYEGHSGVRLALVLVGMRSGADDTLTVSTDREAHTMSDPISADDAYQLTLLLIEKPWADQVFLLRDELSRLAKDFLSSWLQRRLFATRQVREDLDVILQLTKRLADILSPPQASTRDEMRTRILCNLLAKQMRTIEVLGLLGNEKVTEGPDPEHAIAPLMRRLHQAARLSKRELASQQDTAEPSATSDAPSGSRVRFPEYDNLIAGISKLFQALTGRVPRFSDRPAQLERPRKLVGEFTDFALQALPLVGRVVADLELGNDPDWRRLARPTPDEIREAYRRGARKGRT